MTTTSTTLRPPLRPPRRTTRGTTRRFVPPQHGAWAMLLLPYLAGVLVAGPAWPHLPLLGAWLAGYLFSYYALQAVKTRRPQRFRAQLLAYGPITALLAGIVVLTRPDVLRFAPAYTVLLALNTWYAWRRRERAVGNDLASVAQSCLMVFVTAVVAGVTPGEVAPAFIAVLLYLAGTVLYIKTMIRERGSVGYRRASVVYHLLAFGVAAWLSLPLGALFALLLLRAWVLPGRSLVPKQVGILEIAHTVLLLVVICWW